MIFKIDTYVDDKNRTVLVKTPEMSANSITDVKTEYIGSAVLSTPEGGLPIQFPFPETITTISGCFEQFDTVIKEFIEEKRREAKNRIIKPDELFKK